MDFLLFFFVEKHWYFYIILDYLSWEFDIFFFTKILKELPCFMDLVPNISACFFFSLKLFTGFILCGFWYYTHQRNHCIILYLVNASLWNSIISEDGNCIQIMAFQTLLSCLKPFALIKQVGSITIIWIAMCRNGSILVHHSLLRPSRLKTLFPEMQLMGYGITKHLSWRNACTVVVGE